MKKVFLYAYDKMNIGDDLFIRTLANRYPNIKFYLWSSAVNKTTFSSTKNLVVLDSESSWIKILRKIRPSFAAKYKNRKENVCDCIVFIGGSIFIEYENWQRTLAWWEYETLYHKIYILGANFGPYHNEGFRDGFAKIFANTMDVCLRDRYSQSLFSDVKTVRYAPDILFSYPVKEIVSDEKQVFVSIIDCSSKDEGDNKLVDFEHSYIETLIRLLTDFIKKGYKVVLSSFCKAEGDENAVERIRSGLPKDRTKVINYSGTNSQGILDEIGKSAIIIASRFHATIFGFAAGKPVLPIIYSDKTKNVLDDSGFQGKYLDIRHLEPMDTDSLLMDIDGQKLAGVDKLKKQSELHFLQLDKILKNGSIK